MAGHWTQNELSTIRGMLKNTWRVPDHFLPFQLPTTTDIAALNVETTDQVKTRGNLLPTLNPTNATIKSDTLGGKRWLLVGDCFRVEDRTSLGDRSADFHYAAFRDLDAIYSTTSGRALITVIQNACATKKLKVFLTFGDGFSNRAQASPDGAWETETAKPGTPAGSSVIYNPFLFGLPWVEAMRTDAPWGVPTKKSAGHPSHKPPDVSLFHELVHVSDSVRGLLRKDNVKQAQVGGTKGSTDVAELRAVGIAEFRKPKIFSENSYRFEKGLPERLGYPDDIEGPWEWIALAQYYRYIEETADIWDPSQSPTKHMSSSVHAVFL